MTWMKKEVLWLGLMQVQNEIGRKDFWNGDSAKKELQGWHWWKSRAPRQRIDARHKMKDEEVNGHIGSMNLGVGEIYKKNGDRSGSYPLCHQLVPDLSSFTQQFQFGEYQITQRKKTQ